MFPTDLTKTVLDYEVERYNSNPVPKSFLVFDKIFKLYQPQPTKSFLDINSILPLARLRSDKSEVIDLIKQLLENLRQNAASSTIESRPYFYGLLRAFQLVDNRLFGSDYFKKNLKYTLEELKRLKDLTPQSVALIFLLLEQWNISSEGKARLESELTNDLIKLLDSQQSKLVKKDITVGDDATFPFLIYHTLNLVKLMSKPAGNIAYRVYFSYIHPAMGLGSAVGEQQLKIIPIIAGFTYLAATASVLATPPGWVIGGAVLAGVVGYMGLYKGIKGWWENTKKDWDTYQTLEPDEACYKFCKDVLEILEILKDPKEADKWADVFNTLKEHLPQKHYRGLHAPLANFISMVFIHYCNGIASQVKLQEKAKPWIELCISLCHRPYQRSAAWLSALALFSHKFPSLEPSIWEQLKSITPFFDGNILLEYRDKQRIIRDELSKQNDIKSENLFDITLINQKQEDWLQSVGALTLKPIRDCWRQPHQVINTLSWEQVKPYYIAPRLRAENVETELSELYTQLFDSAKTSTQGQQNTYLLFGEAGMGKSSVMQWLYEKLREAYLQNSYNLEQPIPVFISLASLKQNEGNFIEAWFLDAKRGYTPNQVEQLRTDYRFVLLLDGFDELIFCQGASVAQLTIQNANLLAWRGCTVISSRTQWQHECQVFQAKQSYFLQGFNDGQKKAYLQQRIQALPEQQPLLNTLNLLKTSSVWSLLDTPLLLYMVSDSLEFLQGLVKQQQTVTRYSIYAAFAEKWFVREYERVVTTKDMNLKLQGEYADDWRYLLRQYAEKIAVLMYQANSITISEVQLTAQEKMLLQAVLVIDESSTKVLVKRLRNACPLKAVGNHNYQFIHKSFQEFLVAQALRKALPLTTTYVPDPENPQQLVYDQTDAEIFRNRLSALADNLWNQLELRKEPAVLDFLNDTQPNPHSLLQIICTSKGEARSIYATDGTLNDIVYSGNPAVAQAAGNALTLFIYCGYSADRLNFNQTRVKNANVSNGIFNKAKVENADWSEILANQSQWLGASIQNSRWQLQYGEYPICQYKGGRYEYNINAITSSAKEPNKVIVSYGEYDYSKGYRSIHLVQWNTNEGKILKQKTLDKLGTIITSFVYSSDGEKIIVATAYVANPGFCRADLELWDAQTFSFIRRIMCHASLRRINCSVVVGDKIILGADKDTSKGLFGDSRGSVLIILDLVNENFYGVLDGHTDLIECLAIIDSDKVISGSRDKTLRMWDINTMQCLMIFSGHQGTVTCVASLDKNRIVSGSLDKVLYVWDINTGRRLFDLVGHTDWITAVVECGDSIVSSSKDGTIQIWNKETGKRTYVLHAFEKDVNYSMLEYTKEITYLVATANKVVSGSKTGALHVWDMKAIPLVSIEADSSVKNVLIYKRDILLHAQSNQIYTRDLANPVIVKKLISTVKYITAHNDKFIIYTLNNELGIMDISTGTCQIKFASGTFLNVTAIASNGKKIILGFDYAKLVIMNEGFTDYRSIPIPYPTLYGMSDSVTCISVSDTRVAYDCSSEDHMITVLDVDTGKYVANFSVGRRQNEPIHYMAIQDDTIVSGSRNSCNLLVWSIIKAKYTHIFKLPSHPVKIQFHPQDINWIVVMCVDGTLIVLDINEKREIKKQRWPQCRLVSWDFELGQLVLVLQHNAVLYANVRAPCYWHPQLVSCENPLPPWQICWIKGIAPVDMRDLKISGVQLDEVNRKLFDQWGAV